MKKILVAQLSIYNAFVVYAIEFHLVWNIIVGLNYPRKCLVEEESRLILYEGSKSDLVGFYDPCDESDKHLLIQYLYRGQIHQAQITDREQLRCPRMAHQLETWCCNCCSAV